MTTALLTEMPKHLRLKALKIFDGISIRKLAFGSTISPATSGNNSYHEEIPWQILMAAMDRERNLKLLV
jgi:hypothetical protein